MWWKNVCFLHCMWMQFHLLHEKLLPTLINVDLLWCFNCRALVIESQIMFSFRKSKFIGLAFERYRKRVCLWLCVWLNSSNDMYVCFYCKLLYNCLYSFSARYALACISRWCYTCNFPIYSFSLSACPALRGGVNQYFRLLWLNQTLFTHFTHIADCCIMSHREKAPTTELSEMCLCILTDDFPRSYASHFRWWDQCPSLKFISSKTRYHPQTEDTSCLSPCRQYSKLTAN